MPAVAADRLNRQTLERSTVNNRKMMMFGTTVVGVMLALASVAMACTTFKGRFEVTAGSGVSKAWGKNSGMTHCTGAFVPQSNATVPTTGGTITVGAYPTGTNVTDCPASQLSDSAISTNPLRNRRFHIYYVNKNGFVDNGGVWKWSVDCMAGTGSTRLSAADGKGDEIWIKNGTSTTGGSADPAGTRNYTIPSGQTLSSATDRAGVCISDTGAGQGNQTPLAIV